MKTIILCGLLAALALVLVPPERSAAKPVEDVVLLIEEPAAASALSAAPSADEPEARTVQLKTEDGVETVDEDTYLTAVVLSEMPASFEPEALAAQAVAARTFLARQRLAGKHMDCDVCADSACCQAWSSEATLEAKHGVELGQGVSRRCGDGRGDPDLRRRADRGGLFLLLRRKHGGGCRRLGYRRAIFAGRGKSRRAGRAPL